jgi:hypothetical protein
MAVTVTQVGRRTVFGDRRVGFYDVVFSGTYPDGGEPVTAGLFGLNFIEYIAPQMAPATDRETAVVVAWDQVAGTLLNYESAATGLPLLEKTDSEAYITGQTARIMVVGS